MSIHESSTIHLKIKIKGSLLRQYLFNCIAGKFDRDWPYFVTDKPLTCFSCGGVIYRLAQLNARDIKALAKQINADIELKDQGHLSVKIEQWLSSEKCWEKYGKTKHYGYQQHTGNSAS